MKGSCAIFLSCSMVLSSTFTPLCQPLIMRPPSLYTIIGSPSAHHGIPLARFPCSVHPQTSAWVYLASSRPSTRTKPVRSYRTSAFFRVPPWYSSYLLRFFSTPCHSSSQSVGFGVGLKMRRHPMNTAVPMSDSPIHPRPKKIKRSSVPALISDSPPPIGCTHRWLD